MSGSAHLDAAAGWFAANGVEVTDDGDRLVLGFTGANGAYPCVLLAREPQDELIFYSVAPVSVPHEQRVAVAMLLTRLNYGMALGNFELDVDDGEVRYKTTVALAGRDAGDEVLRPLVTVNVSTMDRYLPALQEVLGGADPHDVARRAG